MPPRASVLPGEMRGLDEAVRHREDCVGLTTRAVLTLEIKTNEHFIKFFILLLFCILNFSHEKTHFHDFKP